MHRPIGSIRVVLAAVLVVAAGSVVLAGDPPSPLMVAYHERLSVIPEMGRVLLHRHQHPAAAADGAQHQRRRPPAPDDQLQPAAPLSDQHGGPREDNRFDESVLGAFGTPTGGTLRAGQQVTFIVPSEVSPFAYDTGIVTADCVLKTPGPGGESVEAEADAQVMGAQVMGARHSVAGRFVCQLPDGSPGGPVAGVVVHLTPVTPNLSTQEWTTVSDRDGRFAFPTVAAGHYQLNFRSPAGYPAGDR